MTGQPTPRPRAGSPAAGSTPRIATTPNPAPRRARSSTCPPSPIRRTTSGRRRLLREVRTAGRRTCSGRADDIRPRSQSRGRRHPYQCHHPRRARTGGRPPPTGGGFRQERREATGCRRPSRQRRTGTLPNTWEGGAPPSRASRRTRMRRLSRRCRRRRPSLNEAAIPRRRRQSTPAGLPPRPLWPPSRHSRRVTQSHRPRSHHRRRGATAAEMSHRPAGSRSPSCSRGFRPPRPGAAVAAAATIELISY